jgi:outer membrane immunogenic protein
MKGGLAAAQIENRAGALLGGGVADPFDLTETDETRLGWALGGGLEYAFRPDWSLKIEYMYMDFGTDTSGNFDGDGFSHDNDLHSVKVGLNYRIQPMLEPLR